MCLYAVKISDLSQQGNRGQTIVITSFKEIKDFISEIHL